MNVSVVITNYNYAHYLPEAIESVLGQSYGDFELIIVDDCSTDESLDLIYAYKKQDNRIVVIEHEKNQGVFCAMKNGFYAAKGTYFHALSADDKYLPGFLEKTLNHLANHPEIGLCCSDFGYFYDHEPTRNFTNKLITATTSPLSFSPRNIPSIFRKRHFWIPGHTTIVKTKLMKEYGFYNPQLHALMDWYLFHHIALFEGAGYIPETLALMRLHQNSYSSQCKKDASIKKAMHKVLFQILEKPENAALKKRFKQSALLGFLFKDPEALKHPRLWSFYPYLIQKSLRYRLSLN